jgi:hypothetical protein
MATREDFKLVRPDSHMVVNPVRGYTHTIDGIHFLLEKALVAFPSLRLKECPHCRALEKRLSSGEYKAVKGASSLDHCL